MDDKIAEKLDLMRTTQADWYSTLNDRLKEISLHLRWIADHLGRLDMTLAKHQDTK